MHFTLWSRQLPIGLLPFVATLASAQTHTHDVIYMKEGGAAFTMDVLTPAKPNRAAVVFVVSGGWISDPAMLERFEPNIERVFVDGGFTVFEVLHGAQPRFKVAEIVQQVRTAVRFVRAHADDYGIDTNRIGVSGISTGGHLSLMIAGSSDSPVDAVAAIAPPTDLADWGKPAFVLTDDPQLAVFVPALGFDPKAPRSEIEKLARQLSPITGVNAQYPPTLIVHGDSDKIVPLQQAEVMNRELAKAGVEHQLDVIPGGGHDENTFEPGLTKALEWFKSNLLKQSSPRVAENIRYPTAAPFTQYRSKSRAEEVALARSAAPRSISANAEVLVLGDHGYETAVKGTNGFVCFVERGWAAPFDDPDFWSPTPRAPNCFNATAARTELPKQLKRTEWALSGASKAEIMKRTRSAYADHTFKTPEPGAMTYMLSKDTRNAEGESWLPHLMFFVPAGQTRAWGACEKSYPIICWRGDEIQSTVFLIPVRAWSDGSPAPPVAVQHAQMKK